MREPDLETLMFFDGHRSALALFEALEDRLLALFPQAQKRVQKTQITYYRRRVFACVSFARVEKKAELPAPRLVLTLGLPYRLESARAAVTTEVYPGRWTTHLILSSEDELDAELLDWMRQAYEYSERK